MSFFPETFIENSEVYNAWDKAREQMGADEMLNAILQMIDTDTANWIVENLNDDYELGLPQFEDEDENEEDDDEDEYEDERLIIYKHKR